MIPDQYCVFHGIWGTIVAIIIVGVIFFTPYVIMVIFEVFKDNPIIKTINSWFEEG